MSPFWLFVSSLVLESRGGICTETFFDTCIVQYFPLHVPSESHILPEDQSLYQPGLISSGFKFPGLFHHIKLKYSLIKPILLSYIRKILTQGFYNVGFQERNALKFEAPARLLICQCNEERSIGLRTRITAKSGAMGNSRRAYDWET